MSSQLLITKDKFKVDIGLRIAEGQAILKQYNPAADEEELRRLNRALERWSKNNHAWLGHVFSKDSSYQRDYENAGAWDTEKLLAARTMSPDSLRYKAKFFRQSITPKIEYLEDLLAQLEFLSIKSGSTQLQQLAAPALTHLHPTVQQAATSLFATNHYPQAIHAACTALEKAIQVKSGQSASVTGTALLGKAFPKDNPLINLSADQGEREGYGFLYRGLLQAIRNHYAHNATVIDPARALEWLSFISALLYKLDEAK
jgi:uncharacterized protein (TIGR02391 family)